MRTKHTTTLCKRLGAWALTLALVVGLLPQTAFAAGTDTGKAIQLGASNISGYDSMNNSYDYIYYGTWSDSPIKWRVLDDQTNFDSNSDGTNDAGLFLLSDGLLGTGNYGGVYFQQNYHSVSGTYHKGSEPSDGDHTNCQIANAWQDSDAQEWCKTFYSSNLTAQEQGAVLATTKSDGAFTSSTYSVLFAASDDILNGDKVFFLSAEEAENREYGFTDENSRIANYGSGAGVWWLRSPYAYDADNAGVVFYSGGVHDYNVDSDWAVRPAFNLNLNSVLFTSAAVGGKSPAAGSGGTQGGEAADAIFEISDYSGNEWKLTLLDEAHKNFEISNATTNSSGNTIAFSYSGAQTGTNEYISVVIEDSGAITHYGRILQLDGTTNGASGTASLTLPADVTLSDTVKLHVFNEQYNGDKMTDYASPLKEISSPTVDTTAPTLTAGTATRDSATTATVTFSSNEAGTYYYAVVDSGGDAPTDLTTIGTSGTCVTGTNTISVTGLSGLGAKDIYIVAKDAIGNVSQSLKISIPEYIAPVYAISADTQLLDFGTVTEGYTQAPAAKTVTITNTGNQTVTVDLPTSTNYTVTAGTGFTNGKAALSSGGKAQFTVQPKTGLGVGDCSETLTISGSNSTSASVKLSFTVNAVYTLTVNLNGGSGSTTGGQYPAGKVVNIDAGSRSSYRFTGWTTSNGGTFADDSSASTTFTMPAADTTITANWQYNGGGGGSSRPSTPSTPTGPATGESSGWEEIGDEIGEAQPGETIVVEMNGTTEVPAEIFEEVAGKDVTVEFDLGGGISWTVNGQDVPTGASFQSLNLGVDMGTSGISANVINNITGEYGSVQITLAHDGEFGFALTLTAPLGSDNAGHWANLYYYHEDSEALTFQTSGRIGADGSVSLRFTHASQYAIVIDDYSHEMPFEDVGEGVWYYDAVSYVYAKGLMGGTSATTFEPNTTTSRAMIAVILWRQAGSPIAEEYTDFSDVAEGAWYTQAVRWASNAGVVGGYPNGSFGPNDPITREQMAAMLYRYAQYQGMEMATLEENLAGFADADKISGYAVQAMNWAVGQGIMGGYGDGTLGPQGNATRAQAAAMLQRFCEAYIDSEE